MKLTKSFGDKFSFKDFAEMCKSGEFIDYDGFGYFGTDEGESEIKTQPSSFANQIKLNPSLLKEYTCVWWYNR